MNNSDDYAGLPEEVFEELYGLTDGEHEMMRGLSTPKTDVGARFNRLMQMPDFRGLCQKCVKNAKCEIQDKLPKNGIMINCTMHRKEI